MAILNKIRQRSLFLILIIAMALFSFVLADLFKNSDGFSSKSQNVVATINGEDITRDDFMSKVEAAQRQFGASLSNTQAMNRVWDQEIRNAIMNEQYDALGITVERDQMRELVKTNLSSFEEFKNEAGVFDENKLNEFIANLKAISPQSSNLGGSPINYQAWTTYENNIAVNGRQQTYYNLIKAGVIGTLAEGEIDYKLENDKVDVKYVQVPFSSIPDSTITVSKSEISSYIKNNKSNYEVEASRDMYYVEFKEEASLEDETAIQNELNGLLEGKEDNSTTETVDETVIGFRNTTDDEEFLAVNSDIKLVDTYEFKNPIPIAVLDSVFNLQKGEVFGPYKDAGMYKISKMIDIKQKHDSIKSRHILIPHLGALRVGPEVTQTEVEAKNTADSLVAALRVNKSKFADFVNEFSSDQGSKTNGGEYNYHPEGQMVKPFSDFEASKRIGELGVVKTDFGFHIIEVLDRKSTKRAVKVGHLAKTIGPSDDTVDAVFNKTSKFEIAVMDKAFDEVAKENNYVLRPVSSVEALNESIPGLGNQRPIIRWAFEADTKVGSVKRFNIQGGYAVVVVSAINKAGLMSTEKASISALPAIRAEKKAEIIKAKFSGTTLEEMASSQGQQVKSSLAINMKNPTLSGAGVEPLVVGTAFGLAENEISNPIEGAKGVYVIQVTKKTPADALTNYQSIANRLGSAKSAAVNAILYNALKEAAEIEDNRATFY